LSSALQLHRFSAVTVWYVGFAAGCVEMTEYADMVAENVARGSE
jgi:hypothetical protein